MSNLGLISPYFRRSLLGLAAGLMALTCCDFGQMWVPLLVGGIIDALASGEAAANGMGRQLAVIMGLAAAVAGLRYAWRNLIYGFSRSMEKDLRARLYARFVSLSVTWHNRNSSGDLMALATNDIESVRLAVGFGLVSLVDSVVLGAAAVVFMLSISPSLCLWAFMPLPLISILTAIFGRRIFDSFLESQNLFGSLTEVVREHVSGFKVIRAMALEPLAKGEIDREGVRYMNRNVRLSFMMGLFFPFLNLLANLAVALTLFFGGRAAITGEISPGEFVAFLSYLGLLAWPLMAMGLTLGLIQQGLASLARLAKVLSAEETLPHPPDLFPDEVSHAAGADPPARGRLAGALPTGLPGGPRDAAGAAGGTGVTERDALEIRLAAARVRSSAMKIASLAGPNGAGTSDGDARPADDAAGEADNACPPDDAAVAADTVCPAAGDAREAGPAGSADCAAGAADAAGPAEDAAREAGPAGSACCAAGAADAVDPADDAVREAGPAGSADCSAGAADTVGPAAGDACEAGSVGSLDDAAGAADTVCPADDASGDASAAAVLRGSSSAPATQAPDLLPLPACGPSPADVSALLQGGFPIVFENVSYTYPGRTEPALAEFSAELDPFGFTALTGPTGSGKSTLASLLPALLEPDSGRILIDGVPSTEYRLDDLRSLFGLVPQEGHIFTGTLLDNIRFGRPGATEEEAVRAAEAAGLRMDGRVFPEGLRTRVGEKGVTLSGGQRQRAALARALLTDPPYLILDDTLSAVDASIEEEILDTLVRVRQGRGTLVVSHRVTSLKRADTFLVLEKGVLTASGGFRELSERPGYFKRIVDLAWLGARLADAEDEAEKAARKSAACGSRDGRDGSAPYHAVSDTAGDGTAPSHALSDTAGDESRVAPSEDEGATRRDRCWDFSLSHVSDITSRDADNAAQHDWNWDFALNDVNDIAPRDAAGAPGSSCAGDPVDAPGSDAASGDGFPPADGDGERGGGTA
ncbi:MAG: ATP-binding cassette domain-containing protein [Deltaproteobacteria bacterium]|jgi:ABC-type multidrug transport system fused ATPase/permease subunit|nr:ATP-binding cassette domain-containing protein [Deltaproteobacteria bacterium]